MSQRSKAIRRQRYYAQRLLLLKQLVPLTAFDDFEHEPRAACPTCDGDGFLDCHCGGDLCVCLNYGERECPTCGGMG